MEFKKEQLIALNNDATFQQTVASDSILNGNFQDRDIDRDTEIRDMFVCLGSNIVIADKIVIKPPSAGVIASLFLIKSPFLDGDYLKLKLIDIDKALHVLIYGKESFKKIKDVDADFDEECEGLVDMLGVEYLQVVKGIREVVNQSFSPFSMLPDECKIEGDHKVFFDSFWLTGIVSIASQMINESVDKLTWDYPLLYLNYLRLNYLSQNGQKGISRRTKESDCLKRLEHLMTARLTEMGMINV